MQIAKKQNSDSPEEVEKLKARELFKPFTSLGESERISLITLLPDNDRQKVLYMNYDSIMRDIEHSDTLMIGTESTTIPFYKLPYDKQVTVIDGYIDAKIPTTTQTVRLGADEIQ